MQRTRRQIIKEEYEQESDEDISEKAGIKNKNKRAKKDNKDDDESLYSKMNKNSIVHETELKTKNEKNIFTKEFIDLIEKIKKNLTKFESKPEYCNKLIDNKNPNLSKLHKITKFKLISPIELYYKLKYEQFYKLSLEEDKCSICQFHFYDEDLNNKNLEEIIKLNLEKKNEYDAVLLNHCTDHFFHIECLINLIGDKESAKCPNCNKIYGILTGNQPKGTMQVQLSYDFSCAGYEDVGTIIIYYNFPRGKGYSGTSRVAYLPDNKEGREVLALLKVAFDRKLTFVIGTSVTTGQENTTIWNGVHHKTNITGGAQYFGYPDPTYFNRVKQELAAKGVLEENINEDLQTIAENLIPDVYKKSNRSNSNRKKRK